MKSGRRRAREFALQGLYQWLLAGTAPNVIRTQLAESGGFAKCDTEFFDELWLGVTGEFDTLVAGFAPYLDRAPGQLSLASEELGNTVFVHYLLRGLAG